MLSILWQKKVVKGLLFVLCTALALNASSFAADGVCVDRETLRFAQDQTNPVPWTQVIGSFEGRVYPIRIRPLSHSHYIDIVSQITGPHHSPEMRSLWARAFDLSRDNPDVPAEVLMQHLDASDFIPVVIADRAAIAWRRASLDSEHLSPDKRRAVEARLREMEAFIRHLETHHQLTYNELLGAIEVHDAMMSTNGTRLNAIRSFMASRFPRRIGYPIGDVSVEDVNAFWSSLAPPVGVNRFRFHYDGNSIDNFGFHDIAHAMLQEAKTQIGPQSLHLLSEEEFIRSQILHAEARTDFFSHQRPTNETDSDLIHLAWFYYDHETNELWPAVMRLVQSRIHVSHSLDEIKSYRLSQRTRSTLSQNSNDFILAFSRFVARFARQNDFVSSLRSAEAQTRFQAAARFAQSSFSAHPRPSNVLSQILENPTHGNSIRQLFNAFERLYEWEGVQISSE